MPMDERSRLEALASFVRTRTREARLTRAGDLAGEPLRLETAAARRLLARLGAGGGFSDIAVIETGKDAWYYSSASMTAQYATLMARVAERDLVRLVAETVREASRLYPRPTAVQVFLAAPYGVSPKELERVYDELGRDPRYADIRECRVSTGARYLYSDRHLTAEHAQGLAEWDAVGRDANP